MKKNIYKRLLSFIILCSLFFGNLFIVFEASALEIIQPILQPIQPILQPVWLQNYTAVQPIYSPKTIMDTSLWSFQISTTSLLNKEILELAPITENNAWKVLNTWTINSTFNKNFVIKPVWTDYDFLVMKLDQKGLTEALEKTNLAKATYAQYKWVAWWIWTLEVETPKMERLPDRLVLTSKTKIKFKTKAEFDNIKKYYKLDEAVVHQALPTKTKSTIWTTAWKLDLINNWRVLWEWTELDSLDSSDILEWLYNNCLDDSGCREKLASELWIDPSDFFITTSRLPIKRPYNSKIDDTALEKIFISDLWESTIEQVEKIEISLLPVNPLSIASFNNNLKLAPEAVRIDANKINTIFGNIVKIANIWKSLEEITPDENPDDKVREICDNYSWTEKTACLKLAENYTDPKTKTYEKILINGITLWNEYNYTFSSSWVKHFSRGFWSTNITIYSVYANLSFGYGFGLRIPIKAKIDISKDTIKANSTNDEKTVNASITVKTIDATAQEYINAWIDSTQIFEWQEFVFKIYAYLEWKLVLVNKTVFDKKYDLITLLWDLLWIEWLHSFDKSKNFTPPFAWTNTISLFSKEYWLEVYKKNYSIWGWTIYADLLFNAYVDWYITAYCKTVNMIWSSCNKTLEFRNVAPKVLELIANVNNNEKQEDLLWEYNEYWIILRDFKYIPQLIATIKSRARLHWWYDFRVWDDSGNIETPRYEIYRYTLDLPALWAHVWYWIDWTYTLTEEQKQIKATDQKIYQKLKEKFYNGLFVVIPWLKWINTDLFVIKPGISNPDFELITPEEDIPDLDIPNEDTEYPWVEWTPTDEIVDDWVSDDWSVDDSAVSEEVAEILNKYLEAANNLADAWVINDKSDNPELYNFSGNIKRNEAAKMAVNLNPSISMKNTCNNSFKDVSKVTPNDWTCWYVEALLDAWKISANQKFNPLSNLSKAEATKMMLESAWCTNVYTHAEFWQAEVVWFASSNWLISHYTDYNTKATRAFVFEIADTARVFCVK